MPVRILAIRISQFCLAVAGLLESHLGQASGLARRKLAGSLYSLILGSGSSCNSHLCESGSAAPRKRGLPSTFTTPYHGRLLKCVRAYDSSKLGGMKSRTKPRRKNRRFIIVVFMLLTLSAYLRLILRSDRMYCFRHKQWTAWCK